jgi:glycosyltransferase involved in cell wall biosynthesis
MNTAPLLTVVALCYQHERFVEECLESIRTQTMQDFQLIIADDGSKDRSKALIRDWIARHRIDAIFVDHSVNQGLLPTLNEVLRLARGTWIAKVATDDAWLPDKLEQQLATVLALPESVAVLYGDATKIDEAGQPLGETFLEEHGRTPPPSGSIASALIGGNFIPSLSTMVRRQALVDVGGWDEQLNYEDWDMWLRLALRHDFVGSPRINARYRVVRNSMARTGAHPQRPQTLMSNLRIMRKVIASGLAERAVVRQAAWNMDQYARALLRQHRWEGLPAWLSSQQVQLSLRLTREDAVRTEPIAP